jgi:molybdopterin converting factor small subunit
LPAAGLVGIISAMSETTVTVLLFARYADLLGQNRLLIPARQAETVAAVVAYLRSLPGGSDLPARPLVAVNHQQVDLEFVLSNGDEIAVLPPMAGG